MLSETEVELFACILWNDAEAREVARSAFESRRHHYRPVAWEHADEYDHEEYREQAARIGEALISALVDRGRLGPEPMTRLHTFLVAERDRAEAQPSDDATFRRERDDALLELAQAQAVCQQAQAERDQAITELRTATAGVRQALQTLHGQS